MNIGIIQLVTLITIINSIIFLIKGNNYSIFYCGIIGYSSAKKKYPSLLKLRFLLYFNSVERGRDATGIFTPLTGIIKKAIAAREFINDGFFKKNYKKSKTSVI